jgi:hypothetical protein
LAYSNNWASLEKQILNAASDTLRTNVFKAVQKCEQKHIQEDVYNIYPNPKLYDRRGYSGGLIADENIILTEIDNLNIEIVNITDPNPDYNGTTDKYLPDLVEHGEGYNGYHYDYPTDGSYMNSRPFIENTKEDLSQNKQHIKAMRDGLKQRGIDIV